MFNYLFAIHEESGYSFSTLGEDEIGKFFLLFTRAFVVPYHIRSTQDKCNHSSNGPHPFEANDIKDKNNSPKEGYYI
jgi:hypothetical protein